MINVFYSTLVTILLKNVTQSITNKIKYQQSVVLKRHWSQYCCRLLPATVGQSVELSFRQSFPKINILGHNAVYHFQEDYEIYQWIYSCRPSYRFVGQQNLFTTIAKNDSLCVFRSVSSDTLKEYQKT